MFFHMSVFYLFGFLPPFPPKGGFIFRHRGDFTSFHSISPPLGGSPASAGQGAFVVKRSSLIS